MPRKYTPVHKIEYDGWCSSDDFHYAEMEEDKNGQWVPLKVFEDETSRLNAAIIRLKKQLNNQYNKE